MNNILFRIACFLMVILFSSCSNNVEKERPNILIIQADDLGYDDIRLYGNNIIETPSLDKLGEQSIQFDQFYLSSVCAPTRAALLTGRNFLRTGVSGVHAGRDYVNLDETIIAEVFKDAGYTTGMWGKWHSGKTDGYFPWDRGFDEAYYACLYNYFDNTGLLNGEPVQTKGFTTDAITDMAISFVKKNKDKPFFAYMSHLAPHNPWRAPESYIKKYLNKGLSEPMATLYGMIDNLDFNIGRLLQTVEDEGLAENTIIVFLSDNGPWIRSYRFGLTDEEWQERNVNGKRGMKGTNWENGIHSPLFIRWTNKFAPKHINEPVKVEDLYPTLCNLVGITIPDSIQLSGQSLLNTSGSFIASEAPIYVAAHNPVGDEDYRSEKDEYGQAIPFSEEYIQSFKFEKQNLAIRKGAYKYVQDGEAGKLFDIITNPTENESALSENKEQFESLQTQLGEWFEEVKTQENSFTMPVFQIGYKQNTTSYMYACAPQSISKGLINKEHFLANWGKVGDEVTYNIKVHTKGKYEVFLVHKIKDYEKICFQVSSSTSVTKSWLNDTGDRNFGTLIEGESAYWENFDLKETFKKDIIKSKLGTIQLHDDDSELKLELLEKKGSCEHEWENQLISIELRKI
ncbi:arylsulfatase [uncultured Draconibacterium sp.]|uniref:arylsulfatase n=1 Tax=uncultured Draconibacterium sp. TaxID=1573823 RepID=UPI0029C0496A|nr:arylsulfatase [uncultured Draconibacterium sp.]